MLASARQARGDRRRFPDLPGQHHPPGAALRRAALAAALAAHRRGGRGAGGGARLPPPRPHRHALAGRQRGLSGEARRARHRVSCARAPPSATEINRIIMDELVYGVFKPEAVAVLPARHRPDEAAGLRRRRARLHRDPADHERRQLAAADARFDAAAGARRAETRGVLKAEQLRRVVDQDPAQRGLVAAPSRFSRRTAGSCSTLSANERCG